MTDQKLIAINKKYCTLKSRVATKHCCTGSTIIEFYGLYNALALMNTNII